MQWEHTHMYVHMYCTIEYSATSLLNHSEWNTSLWNIEDTVCSHNDIELNPNLHLGLVPRPFSAILSFYGARRWRRRSGNETRDTSL